MSVHQLGGPGYPKGASFTNALKGESKIYYVHADGLVTVGKTRPSRESLIADAMSIPTYTFTKAGPTGPTFWSTEKATRCVDAALGIVSEVAA